MSRQKSVLDQISSYFSSTYQIQRLIVLTAILLVVLLASFGGYYYFDRYYSAQPTVKEVSISQAEQAVRDDPNSVEARATLAETYVFNGRNADAITLANQILQVEPDNQRAWLVVGMASARSGKYTDAIEPLQKYLDANRDSDMPGLNRPLQASAYYLGESYLQTGQPDKAVEPLELAVSWSRTDADSMYKLGMAYTAVQEYDQALNMLHAATTFVPDYIEAYEAMTKVYEQQGNTARADFARGMIAYAKKDYQTALNTLLKAAQADPGFTPTMVGLGQTYEAINDLENAKKSYEIAIQLDPNNFTASNGLLRVEAGLKK